MTKPFLLIVTLLAGLLILISCGTRIGPRTSDGTYLNLSGEAVKVYAEPLAETVEAGLQVLASLKVPIHFRRADSGRALIAATALDESPLRIRFTEEGRALTTVTIRTGVVGYWRHEFSYYLHVLIDERLKNDNVAQVDAAQEAQVPAARDLAASGAQEPSRFSAESPNRTKTIPRRTDTAAVSDEAIIDAERTAKPKIASLPSPAHPPESRTQEPEARIYFETDSNFPKSAELIKLDRIARQLFANPSWTLSIEGFAEANENSGRPLMVAESRILAVKFYFIGKGLDDRRLVQTAIDLSENGTGRSAPDRRRVDLWLRRTP